MFITTSRVEWWWLSPYILWSARLITIACNTSRTQYYFYLICDKFYITSIYHFVLQLLRTENDEKHSSAKRVKLYDNFATYCQWREDSLDSLDQLIVERNTFLSTSFNPDVVRVTSSGERHGMQLSDE
jgi:hypothetical protein